MQIDEYIKNYYKSSSLIEHVKQVEKFSVEILEKIIENKEFEYLAKTKKYLSTGSILHDIGNLIQEEIGGKHNKIGAKLILENGIENFSEEETKIISCLVRYHRGKKPKEKHKIYSSLNEASKNITKALSGILQVADMLDFEHFCFIEKINIEYNIGKNIFEIRTIPEISKINGFEKIFEKKKALFEEFFNLELRIV
ncbi:HD domain-containing protein [bacterium]|nr:HD domain-containing protein [bacterium]